ncbi:MAG: hypothetical protein FJZ47_24105 [Candidatus Tectomicrobia bacterium]|uniref:Tetratricopeptide repeat protein n=1 Tax=Tectimicrobiota bacterium TaxID=2528274 RepID=A0A938B4V0_UNCTE|nr:hypothetical protein [Candidatus Tectomicrobia bacterium]
MVHTVRGWLHRLGLVGAMLTLLGLQGCATSTGHYPVLERQLALHDYVSADAIVSKNVGAYPERDVVLYALDRAVTLHLAGRYAESNAFLAQAEARIEALYTKSITTGIGAMFTNDALLPYEGEDFEKVQINLLAALNYVYLGQLDEALVEARKVDLKLTAYGQQYPTKPVYKEDAFARYLSGILYEARGELNDAFIAYRKALEAYEVYQQAYGTPLPPMLPGDLLRVTEALGLREEYATYRQRFPTVSYIALQTLRSQGELIYLSYHGLAPVKLSSPVAFPVPGSAQRPLHVVQLAFPAFVPRPSSIASVQVVADSGNTRYITETHLVQDITAIARKDLQDRLGRISTKTLARAATKYAAARGLEEGVRRGTGNDAAGLVVGILANIAGAATERADTRSWRTLPAALHLARLALPPGTYTVSAAYQASSGSVLEERAFPPITVVAGTKTFLSSHLLR